MSFRFDERAFKKAIEGEVRKGMQTVLRKNQAAFDRLYESHKGKPIREVAAALRSLVNQLGWTATDGELRPYAKAISLGRRIEFRLGETRW